MELELSRVGDTLFEYAGPPNHGAAFPPIGPFELRPAAARCMSQLATHCPDHEHRVSSQRRVVGDADAATPHYAVDRASFLLEFQAVKFALSHWSERDMWHHLPRHSHTAYGRFGSSSDASREDKEGRERERESGGKGRERRGGESSGMTQNAITVSSTGSYVLCS